MVLIYRVLHYHCVFGVTDNMKVSLVYDAVDSSRE